MKALKKQQIAVILVLSVVLSTFAAVTPVSAASLSAQQYLEKMDIAVRNLKSYDFTQTTDQKMTMEGQIIQNKTVVKQSVYNSPLKVKSVTDTTTVLAGMSSKNQAVAYLTKDADGLLWEYISSNGSGYQKTGILNYTNQIKGMDISMYSDAKIVKKKIKVNRINTVQISAQVKGSDVVKFLDQMGMSKEINAAAAVGTGTVGDGRCNISLGTSGTIFISSNHFGVDQNNALHSFAHADGHYHLMGCMLSAASCNKWWMDEIIGTKDYAAEQAQISKLGENHVYFLPYLMGERSPHNDPNARGTFIGMTMDTSRADMTQAVLEGVAFALRDSLEVAKSLGIHLERTKICGGGAKSPLWKKMIANILNLKVDVIESEEGPAMGGAMLAAVACGEYASVEEIAEKFVKVTGTVEPDPELVAKYEDRYQKFRQIYPACKPLFEIIK